jgi:hypothetical protein
LIQPHLEKNQPLQTVAANGKVPFRTAQRWVSQYRKFGLVAVALHYKLKGWWLVFSNLSPFNTPVIVVKADTPVL